MNRSAPSEEKLLKLIRRKDKKGKQTKGIGFGVKGSDFDVISFFNKFLIFASFVLLGVIIYKHLTVETKDIADSITAPIVTRSLVSYQQKDVPFESFEQKFKDRDLFDTAFKKKKPVKEVKTSPPPAANPISHLKLVGVVLDEKPQVIIEDSKTKQTFFLNKGDTVQDVVVKEIFEGRAVLLYKGSEYEIVQ